MTIKLILIALTILTVYGGSIYFLLRWTRKSRLRNMKKVADEMVESGEITRSEADAIIWLVNYSSKKKK
jgi:hypothetical protein